MKTKAQIIKELLKELPYYTKIGPSKGRYHGVKDKAWTILSDYVRCRDWIIYKTCISSNKPIGHWRDADAGHFYTMAGHGAYLGFNDMNIHMQSSIDNKLGSAHSGAIYRDNLEKRYGKELLEYLEKARNETVKADDFWFIEKIKEIHTLFIELVEKYPNTIDFPPYIML